MKNRAELALYDLNIKTGLVVSIGGDSSYTIPVINGKS